MLMRTVSATGAVAVLNISDIPGALFVCADESMATARSLGHHHREDEDVTGYETNEAVATQAA
jgi:hypothetical protein